MTDLTPDEQRAEDAKTAALLPPDTIPDAATLPDDVADGNADSDDGADTHEENQP